MEYNLIKSTCITTFRSTTRKATFALIINLITSQYFHTSTSRLVEEVNPFNIRAKTANLLDNEILVQLSTFDLQDPVKFFIEVSKYLILDEKYVFYVKIQYHGGVFKMLVPSFGHRFVSEHNLELMRQSIFYMYMSVAEKYGIDHDEVDFIRIIIRKPSTKLISQFGLVDYSLKPHYTELKSMLKIPITTNFESFTTSLNTTTDETGYINNIILKQDDKLFNFINVINNPDLLVNKPPFKFYSSI